MDRDSRQPANVLVIGAFVGILEPAPSADIVHQNAGVLRLSTLDILEHLRQRVSPLDIQTALPLIGIEHHDLQTAALGVFPNHVHLVAGGVLLVLRGHPHVSGGIVGWQDCSAGAHGK